MFTMENGLALRALDVLLRPLLRHFASPAAPQYQGEIRLRGLENDVKVSWQSPGIPHVFAAHERDLFFAQGYLHAQERLWQMDLNRRFLSGRTAELFGRFPVPPQELTTQFRGCDSVDVDHFMRLLGMRQAALNAAEVLGEDERARLESYSAGVNAFIESCGRRLPLEFRLLRYRPDPWCPEDTLTIGKGFAFLLSLALFTRLNALPIAAKLAEQPQKFADLYPSDLGSDFTTARAVWDATRSLWHFTTGLNSLGEGFTAGLGSNAWVISRERSDTGCALLCNDPHLRITLPSMWYLMHLCSGTGIANTEPYEVWGATLPGWPGVHVGHNRHIAWGVTAALCDDVELYREKIHRLEPDRYEIDGHWHVMSRNSESIKVKGEGTVHRIVRWTRHGPVISDFQQSRPGTEVISLRWTAHEANASFRALYKLNHARNWDQFLEALSHQVAPTLNVVYADNAGNIGFALAGKVPLRGRPPSLLPSEGWHSANEWRGFVPFDDLPRVFNPPEGVLANANNPIANQTYRFYLSKFFEPPYRVRRIYELIGAKRMHGIAEMATAQADKLSIHARDLIATLSEELTEIRDTASDVSAPAQCLLQWDGHCGADSIAATIFHVFHQRLLKNLVTPVLGEDLFITYVEIFNQSILPIENLLRIPGSPWLQGMSRAELVRSTLVEACDEIRQSLGPDSDRWQWGRLHTLTLGHPFSRISFLRPFFSAGPFPMGGDNFTLDLGFYRHSNPYQHIVGPSLRMIVEAGPKLRSLFILPSGQSGYPFSPHYLDQVARWQKHSYIELSQSHEEMRGWPLLTFKANINDG
jgi:penicillin amidase